MKNTNYIILLVSLFFCMSCAKDGGFYDQQIKSVEYNGTVYEYLKSQPGVFDSLIQVIDRVGLQEILNDSAITLFAPSNQSFRLAIENLNNTRKLAEQPIEFLSSIQYEHLDTMASQYIIRGVLPTDSMQRQDGIAMRDFKYNYPMHAKLHLTSSSGYQGGGPTLIDFSDTKRSQFYRNWVTTSTASINIKTSNGIVHVVNQDHVFGFNAFVSRLTYIPPPPNLFVTVGGTYSVSNENSGGPNAVEASKYVFDGNPETKYLYGGIPGDFWLQVQFAEPQVANAYTLTSANDDPNRDPTDWRLQGSQDGSTWVALDSKVSEVFASRFQLRVFRFANTTAYKYYRINFMRLRSGNVFQLADWSMNIEER
ncbi:fasciclin domain-containing protein [Sphingobacterium hungaricum]|uniref:ATP/GTP-binding protein n=1 Tax=Sphingobacterium hungaricum TaxID=2082723 RepID=A0A928UXA0_9SPHI|nr:fasciclin domain-containing protein [Sphingobacterium hungaricum]MBE8712264.1 ATP/GTP-binding protein [Sphingobacterium hungaricum]